VLINNLVIFVNPHIFASWLIGMGAKVKIIMI